MRNKGRLLSHANIAMLEKLNENDHKPDWEKESLRDHMDGVQEETKELNEEVLNSNDPYKIRREAADVCNRSAMIILFCDDWIARIEKNKSKSGFAQQTGNRFGGGYGD